MSHLFLLILIEKKYIYRHPPFLQQATAKRYVNDVKMSIQTMSAPFSCKKCLKISNIRHFPCNVKITENIANIFTFFVCYASLKLPMSQLLAQVRWKYHWIRVRTQAIFFQSKRWSTFNWKFSEIFYNNSEFYFSYMFYRIYKRGFETLSHSFDLLSNLTIPEWTVLSRANHGSHNDFLPRKWWKKYNTPHNYLNIRSEDTPKIKQTFKSKFHYRPLKMVFFSA